MTGHGWDVSCEILLFDDLSLPGLAVAAALAAAFLASPSHPVDCSRCSLTLLFPLDDGLLWVLFFASAAGAVPLRSAAAADAKGACALLTEPAPIASEAAAAAAAAAAFGVGRADALEQLGFINTCTDSSRRMILSACDLLFSRAFDSSPHTSDSSA